MSEPRAESIHTTIQITNLSAKAEVDGNMSDWQSPNSEQEEATHSTDANFQWLSSSGLESILGRVTS
jgi:hypothetical protein